MILLQVVPRSHFEECCEYSVLVPIEFYCFSVLCAWIDFIFKNKVHFVFKKIGLCAKWGVIMTEFLLETHKL